MKELLLVLHQKDIEALGAVRKHQQIEIAEAKEWIWLRCALMGAEAEALQQLPAYKRYELEGGNKLFPLGGSTPVALLQNMRWIPIQKFVPLEMPVAAMPGKVDHKCPIRLLASDRVEEGKALLTSLQAWSVYAENAPEIRLKQLSFALSEKQSVLIIGTPLPPVPGQEYWLREGNLLPAGFDFEFPLVASLLAARLNPLQDRYLLFHADASFDAIPKEAFVPATRSGVRLSREGLTHD